METRMYQVKDDYEMTEAEYQAHVKGLEEEAEIDSWFSTEEIEEDPENPTIYWTPPKY